MESISETRNFLNKTYIGGAFMTDTELMFGSFSVGVAERRDIDEEWGRLKWDNRHFQINYHRLYYPTSGRAALRLIDRQITLEAGRVYFIPAYSILGSDIVGSMNKYFIHFQVDSPVLDMYKYISDRFSVPAGDNTEFLFDTVVDNYTDSSLSAYLKVQGALDIIMSDFVGELATDRSGISKFGGVISYINDHFTEDIPLSMLADMMNLSKMYFANSFKRTFNISPRQYILNKRLTESQKLLIETKMSVKEIAYAVGFDNENYFSEYFTRKVGVSALRFRNRRFPSDFSDKF